MNKDLKKIVRNHFLPGDYGPYFEYQYYTSDESIKNNSKILFFIH